MEQRILPLHEAMELHELLNFKTISMVKSKMLSGLVFDQDLKALLEKDVRQSMTDVPMLQGLYTARTQVH
jgi:similar to spore coat protein